jgi:hypothetical protein
MIDQCEEYKIGIVNITPVWLTVEKPDFPKGNMTNMIISTWVGFEEYRVV